MNKIQISTTCFTSKTVGSILARMYQTSHLDMDDDYYLKFVPVFDFPAEADGYG